MALTWNQTKSPKQASPHRQAPMPVHRLQEPHIQTASLAYPLSLLLAAAVIYTVALIVM
jgi:hypothetical protein